MSFLDKAMHGKRRESYQGDEVGEHGEAQAERLLRKGLNELGWGDQDLQGRGTGGGREAGTRLVAKEEDSGEARVDK